MVTLEIIEVGATVHYNNGNKRPIFLEKCIQKLPAVIKMAHRCSGVC